MALHLTLPAGVPQQQWQPAAPQQQWQPAAPQLPSRSPEGLLRLSSAIKNMLVKGGMPEAEAASLAEEARSMAESGGLGVAAGYLEAMAEGNPKTEVIKRIIEGWGK